MGVLRRGRRRARACRGGVGGPGRGPRRRAHGGGALIGSALAAGLVDALRLHLAPVVLGAGTPLFIGGPPRTLVQRSVTATSTATHLTYDVV